jgi:hypothetical protein
MWLRPVNGMTELVSGMPAPQFGDEDQSRFKVQALLCLVLIDARCFRIARGGGGVGVPQDESTGLCHCRSLTSPLHQISYRRIGRFKARIP